MKPGNPRREGGKKGGRDEREGGRNGREEGTYGREGGMECDSNYEVGGYGMELVLNREVLL